MSYTQNHVFVYIRLISFLFLAIFYVGCSQLPQFFGAVQDIETQEAIKIVVDKEAINQQTDVQINLIVKNKDE